MGATAKNICTTFGKGAASLALAPAGRHASLWNVKAVTSNDSG